MSLHLQPPNRILNIIKPKYETNFTDQVIKLEFTSVLS